MENRSNFAKEENPTERDEEDSIETEERRSLAEPNITGVSSENDRTPVNSFEKGAASNSAAALEETSALSRYAKGIDGTEGRDGLAEKIEANATARVASVDRLDEAQERAPRFEPANSDGLIESKTKGEVGERRHRRSFCDVIGKRTRRRMELEKREGDLRQRLDMLECSMPAVMMLNVCKMAQGASACRIKRILEKQFEAASEFPCRSTPSCHYDCRVREVEAERKLALKKVEEARSVWAKKLAMLEERKKRVEEARRIQEEQKSTIERLNEEIKVMRETAKTVETDEPCDCGDTQCKWLSKMSSVTSIQSGDIRCLEKLQQLAEEEVIMKRDIAELERREDAYMRTLQQTEELWARTEGDADSSTMSVLREQLSTKTAANQQLADRVCELEDTLEKCRMRMNACRTELEKFLSIEKIEAAIGRDDDVALVADKKIAVEAKVVDRPIGRLDDVATVKDSGELAKAEAADEEALAKVETLDEEALAKVETLDEEALAKVEALDEEALVKVEAIDEETSAIIPLADAVAEVTFVGDDKWVSVKPDSAEFAVDRQIDLVPVKEEESIVRQADFDYEQQKFEEVRKYLAELGSLEELYKDGEACPPDILCNDEVSSPTGMTDEELIALGVEPDETTEKIRGKLVAGKVAPERQFGDEVTKVEDDVGDDVAKKEEEEEEKAYQIPDAETVRQVVMKEKAADDRPLAAPETKIFEADQNIVIKRNEILSWIDRIDTIRAKTREREVRKEADILAEQIGAYVGIKPREVMLDKMERELGGEEVKFMLELTAELAKIDAIATIQTRPVIPPEAEATKVGTEDKLMVVKEQKEESVTQKLSIPTAHSQEISAEVDPTREKISADVAEPFKTVPTEISRVERLEPYDETTESTEVKKTPIAQEVVDKDEEIISEHSERIEMKVEGVSEEEIMKVESEPHAEILETKKTTSAPPVAESKEIESTDVEVEPTEFMKEAPFVTEQKEIEHIDIKETTEYTKDVPLITEKKEIKDTDTEAVTPIKPVEEIQPFQVKEEIKIVSEEVSPVAREKEVEEDVEAPPFTMEEKEVEKVSAEEISQVAKETEIEERVDMEKISHVVEKEEVKRDDAEEIPYIVEEKDVEKIDAEEVPYITEETEVEKIDEISLLVKEKEVEKVDVEKVPQIAKETELEESDIKEITVVVEERDIEKVSAEEIPQIAKETKAEKVDTEKVPYIVEETEPEKSDIKEITVIAEETEVEKVDTEKVPHIVEKAEIEKVDVEEVPLVAEEKVERIDRERTPVAEEEKVEEVYVEKTIPSKEIDEVELQIDEVPPIVDVIEIEKHEPSELPIVDIAEVPKEKIEEIESIEAPTLVEKYKEIEEISPKVTPPTVPLEKREEKLPKIKEEAIPEEVVVPTKLAIGDKIEKVRLEEERLEVLIAEDKIFIVKADRTEAARTSTMPVDSRLTASPYLVVDQRANIVKRELLHVIPVAKPPSTESKSVSCHMQPPLETAEIIEIARADVARMSQIAARISTAKSPRTDPPSVQIIRQHLKPPELKASTEIAGDHPEITGRKMLWRLKDQSTVTTACAGSQTDKTSHVSHDRVERERVRMPTDELLRSIKIAGGLTRGDTEREIRTINYGKRSADETGKAVCDCCLCGGIASSTSSVMPRLQVRPQTDAKIVTPQAAAFKRAFIPVKTDRLISRDRLCPDCKVKIQGVANMRDKYHHIEEITKKISYEEQESRLCLSLSTGKSHSVTLQKRKKVETRDQSCLAKILKRKSDFAEQKEAREPPTIPVDTKESDVKPLTPSCICFQLERPGAAPMRKGNCHCAD